MRINLSEIAKLLLIYLIGIVLLICLWSCNSVNKVLANVESVQKVRAATDPLYPCANNSLVFIHDSATVVETTYLRDTLVMQRNDTTFVNYFDTAIVYKTNTKTINTVVVDKREVNKLQDSINVMAIREAKLQGAIHEQRLEYNKVKDSKSIWRMIAICLFIAFIGSGIIKLMKIIK
jgi:alpha-L-arabinofuranosidase